MHKGRYKFAKKRNKCDVTIKSTITKHNYERKKKRVVETIKKFTQKETKLEREKERESIDLFAVNNLERI